MRLVFEKFESYLLLSCAKINVLRIASPSLYARCALSLSRNFPSDSLEPAFLFHEEKELKPDKFIFFVGDLLALDLNDKRIVSLASKTMLERIAAESGMLQQLESINMEIEEIFFGQFIQMSANYFFSDDWDGAKFFKMMGFGLDDTEDRTLHEKLIHLLKVAADLFPEKILSFVNLPIYLSDEQYNEFCETAISLQLIVLSYEQGDRQAFRHFENGLFIDANYLES